MKNKTILISILLMLAAIGLAACGPAAASSGAAEPRTVSVNGTGTIIVSPDMATVQVGVVTEGDDADKASAANTAEVQKIKEALLGLGIDESDLKTTNFSVYPMQQYDDQGQVTKVTYRVENTMEAKVYDLDSLGSVLDAAIQAGANSIYGVQFDLSDRESANAQAIDAAMQNAMARAEVLAQAAGAELGEIQSVSTYLSGGGTPMYAQAAAGESPMRADVPVNPGEMQIQVDVTVVYAIN
ncbi:MAG: SIMPL domain-containing protein [Anaerolineales bacterium]|jgi:uncharacterized protein YggE